MWSWDPGNVSSIYLKITKIEILTRAKTKENRLCICINWLIFEQSSPSHALKSTYRTLTISVSELNLYVKLFVCIIVLVKLFILKWY